MDAEEETIEETVRQIQNCDEREPNCEVCRDLIRRQLQRAIRRTAHMVGPERNESISRISAFGRQVMERR